MAKAVTRAPVSSDSLDFICYLAISKSLIRFCILKTDHSILGVSSVKHCPTSYTDTLLISLNWGVGCLNLQTVLHFQSSQKQSRSRKLSRLIFSLNRLWVSHMLLYHFHLYTVFFLIINVCFPSPQKTSHGSKEIFLQRV